MKKLACVLCLLCLPLFAGCAGCQNDIAARGGLLGEYKGPYVVISQSGGEIMDCWVLQNAYVQSESDSDGWRFTDASGNVNFVGGDTKVIRIKDADDLSRWHEYHMEFETRTYRSLYGQVSTTGELQPQ